MRDIDDGMRARATVGLALFRDYRLTTIGARHEHGGEPLVRARLAVASDLCSGSHVVVTVTVATDVCVHCPFLSSSSVVALGTVSEYRACYN